MKKSRFNFFSNLLRQ